MAAPTQNYWYKIKLPPTSVVTSGGSVKIKGNVI